MPTYGFRCPEGHEFDRFYKTISTAPATVECPQCGKVGERQLHGGAGLLFKGSGFYLTDYGKNAHRPKGEPTASEKPSEKTNEKADAKPVATTDAKPEKKSDAKTESPKPAAESKPAKKPRTE